MKYLELRRHSLRTSLSVHLSQEGVELARQVGIDMGPFCRVISSHAPWTSETAIAMGYAIDEQYTPVEFENSEWEALGKMLPDGTPFAVISEAFRNDPLCKRFAEALRLQWKQYAHIAPEGESMLIITHGGYIDNSAVACLPNIDHRSWGEALGRCEGIRLGYESSEFVSGEIVRVKLQI